MSSALRVMVVGQLTHDRYDDEIVPGGCAFYGAHSYQSLGAAVELVTSVGHDFRFRERLEQQGTTVSWQQHGETTVFTNRYQPGQPRLQTVEAQAPPVITETPTQPAPDLTHLAPVMGDVDLGAWKAQTRGGLIAISVQGWIKHAGAVIEGTRPPVRHVVPKRWEVSVDELTGIDAACVGEEDLIGQGDLLRRLCAAVPIVALTLGHLGCLVIVRGKTHRVGIYSTTPRDVTGAGDAFAAGFLHELAQGRDPVEAAQLGAAVASIIVEDRGAGPIDRRTAFERAASVPVERPMLTCLGVHG